MIYLTGDTHGYFGRVISFCKKHPGLNREDVLIILGDAGLNYYGDRRDEKLKKQISRLPVTIFAIHGNHEMRPAAENGYVEQQWRGGTVYIQREYPNLLFAKDGEIFEFNGCKTMVAGGAYSVDKYYRIERGQPWFPDEQPDAETKERVERRLASEHWRVDVMLTHTCPRRLVPTEVFIPRVDQRTVETGTEDWLDEIETKLQYSHWFCGHFHTSKRVGKLRFLYEEIVEWPRAVQEGEDEAHSH